MLTYTIDSTINFCFWQCIKKITPLFRGCYWCLSPQRKIVTCLFWKGRILETCLVEEIYEAREECQLSGSFKKGFVCPHTAPRMYQRKTVDSIPLCCCSCHWQGNMLGCAVYVGSGEVWIHSYYSI